jgi:hypothetical protein
MTNMELALAIPYEQLTKEQLTQGIHESLNLLMWRGTQVGLQGDEAVTLATSNGVLAWLHDTLCPEGDPTDQSPEKSLRVLMDLAKERIHELEVEVAMLKDGLRDFYACELCNKPKSGLNGPRMTKRPVVYHRASYAGDKYKGHER